MEKKVDIPSYAVVAGDIIGVREKTSSRQVATKNLEGSQYHPAPPWVEVNIDSLQGTVSRLPQADEQAEHQCSACRRNSTAVNHPIYT